MLTRSLLRTKIAQILYANIRNGKSLQAFDDELQISIKKSYDLYYMLLLLPQEVASMARREVDSYSSRLLKTDRNIKPIANLAEQSFVKLLAANEDIVRYVRDNSISWLDYKEVLEELYRRLKSTPFFDKYIKEEGLDFDTEKTFWRRFYRSPEIFGDNFQDFVEELSLYIADDLEITLSFVDKTISHLPHDDTVTSYPMLPMYRDDNEREFVAKLAHTVFLKGDQYEPMISKIASKWDVERINKMDMVLMKMAIAEFKEFPLIPLDVTINEYIEIAKYYSTEKSYIFINGILNKIAKDMLADGSMEKIK
ncbi:MAG: transcription antitermination factor NusB [Bacteroidota bacterium]